MQVQKLHKISTYQKVEDTKTKHFKCNAHMAMIVKPVKHFNTQAEKRQRITYISLKALEFYEFYKSF